MNINEIQSVCALFDTQNGLVTDFKPYGNGNINYTYLVEFENGKRCILQKINTAVFKNPDELMQNILNITSFVAKGLKKNGEDVERGTLSFFATKDNKSYALDACGGAWRMCTFIENTTAYDSVEKEGLLFEAARTFGNFQKLLGKFPAETLFETIPDFHNTAKRYDAFVTALENDAAGRAGSVEEEVNKLISYSSRSSVVTEKLASGEIPTRVTHNDTKLNNVLIDNESGKGICVIDLDTVMPGSLLYDFGDSVRFAANNGAEDDKELSNVWLNLDLFREYVSGFLCGVGDSITEAEKELLPMSVFLLTYELALRFMTDYLNGDTYFKIKYPEHNIVRTRAQIRLMEDIDAKLDEMAKIVSQY